MLEHHAAFSPVAGSRGPANSIRPSLPCDQPLVPNQRSRAYRPKGLARGSRHSPSGGCEVATAECGMRLIACLAASVEGDADKGPTSRTPMACKK